MSRHASDPAAPGREAGSRPPAVLAADDLVLGYGDGPVVDGESLTVRQEAVTAIVGPNGSGKSTLLAGLAGQHAPDDGTVLLDGQAVHDLGSKALARQLGLLSLENTAPGDLTVESLVEKGRYPYQGFLDRLGGDDRAAVDRAIDTVGIDDLRDRPVGELSGGQTQLAWLAMTLAQEPDVLLLDEPTTYLDVHHQLRVLDAVERLHGERDTTVVLVLHDIEQAARRADDLVVLDEGAVVGRGPPETVVTEDLLADVFGVAATVETGGETVRVHPRRALDGR